MPRYKITLEYDGTPYCGFQIQRNQKTVQSALEHALASWVGHPVKVSVSGRTDAGVHALGQVVHVDLENATPYKIEEATNHFLRLGEEPIALLNVEEVPDTFHARFQAIRRKYMYRIINRRPSLTLDLNRAWHVHKPLDVELMNEAAQILVGRHDFSTFRAADCQSRSPIKTLEELSVIRTGQVIEIHTKSKSFLHHQVRNMVGALKMVGESKWTKEDLRIALEAKDRTKGGVTAPPGGLYFVEVVY